MCEVDLECCFTEWDPDCVAHAQQLFPELCAAPTEDTEAYHVVTIRGVNASVVLDGFTIESGRANGAGGNLVRGGGLLIEDAWPIIFDCIFLRNRAIEGGGVAVISDQQPIVNVIPLLLNCRFNGNVVDTDGGGLHASGARPVLVNCTIAGNSATAAAEGHGGGVFSGGDGGEVMLVNCTLAGNEADLGGGVAGIVEFLDLLGHWGPCPGVDAEPELSLQSAIEGAGLVWPSDWDAFEATMTDPNASEAEKDRWSCWMDHYLDIHSRQFFIEWPNPCPAPDPFGGH